MWKWDLQRSLDLQNHYLKWSGKISIFTWNDANLKLNNIQEVMYCQPLIVMTPNLNRFDDDDVIFHPWKNLFIISRHWLVAVFLVKHSEKIILTSDHSLNLASKSGLFYLTSIYNKAGRIYKAGHGHANKKARLTPWHANKVARLTRRHANKKARQ